MWRFLAIPLFLIAVLLANLAFSRSRYSPKMLGIYDPEGRLDGENNISIQNIYFSWDDKPEKISESLEKYQKLGRVPLITLEPWPGEGKNLTGDKLLDEIGVGKYDQTIDQICRTLSEQEILVLIRWGHEMELPASRYPWSGASPQKYLQAYKHFVDKCRTCSDKFRFVWSPAGEEGLEKYWPGEDYVDIVGLSLYSFDKWEREYIGYQRSFSEIFSSRYDRVKNYNKPILIAEMGVTGSDSYKIEWVSAMHKDLGKYKQLVGLVYFNFLDTEGAWEKEFGIPDWRIPKEALQPFLSNLIKKEETVSLIY